MKQKKAKLWSIEFILVLVIALLSFVICQGLNNGTPIYVSLCGGTNAFAGWLIMEFSIFAALARIFISGRIDYSSRRNIMLMGACFTFLGSFGAVIFPVLEAHLIYRAIQGVGFGLCTTAASTAAADIVPMDRLGEGLGYYGLGQSLGMVIGPSLAIVLVTFTYEDLPLGPETLFAGMSLLAVLLIVAILCCTYERYPERLDPSCAYRIELKRQKGVTTKGVSQIASEPIRKNKGRSFLSETFEIAALPGALPMVVICLGYSIITNFVSKYGVEAGLNAPSVYFVFAAITMTIVRLVGGRFIDEMRPLFLLIIPVICGVLSFILMALTTTEIPFYFSGALFGISMGIAFPLFNTVAVRCSPMDRRGAATALYLLANDIGVGIGAVIGGFIIDACGYTVAFWEGAVMIFCAFLVAAFIFPKKKSVQG